eukprot:m.82903 g.82903  ORF g.82903 m.82903 type:complete len:85 (+) comp14322_c0_seq4:237-491(+)
MSRPRHAAKVKVPNKSKAEICAGIPTSAIFSFCLSCSSSKRLFEQPFERHEPSMLPGLGVLLESCAAFLLQPSVFVLVQCVVLP